MGARFGTWIGVLGRLDRYRSMEEGRNRGFAEIFLIALIVRMGDNGYTGDQQLGPSG